MNNNYPPARTEGLLQKETKVTKTELVFSGWAALWSVGPSFPSLPSVQELLYTCVGVMKFVRRLRPALALFALCVANPVGGLVRRGHPDHPGTV
jgi:hypothetical protein